MAFVLDTTTTDQYQYLPCPDSSQVTLQISNAAVLVGFGTVAPEQQFRAGAGTYPANDEPYLPSLAGLSRECDEIRVKSYAAGVPAQVKVIAQ